MYSNNIVSRSMSVCTMHLCSPLLLGFVKLKTQNRLFKLLTPFKNTENFNRMIVAG